MTTFQRLKHLCQNETRYSAESAEDPKYKEWLASKRSLNRDDIAGKWLLKIGDQCGGYLARCETDGTLNERDVFDPTKSWPGSWTVLENGILEITVPSGNEETGPVTCTLNVVANREGQLHSGAEGTSLNDNLEIFKVIDLGIKVALPQFGDGSKIKKD